MSKLTVAFVIIVGLVGIVIGVNLANTQQQDLTTQATTSANNNLSTELNTEIAALKMQVTNLIELVNNEKMQRESLQTDFANIKQQLTLVNTQQASTAQSNTSPSSEEPVAAVATSEQTAGTQFQRSDLIEEAQTTSSILAAIGVDPEIAENIEELSEKREMDQLYMRNTAIREGWFGTEKYFQENRKFEQESNVIRSELGDSKYDEYLYTSGRFNRIKVSSVLAQSPAEQAGIQSGDVIVSYDNARVFSWSDLTNMTATGEPGETVQVSVAREGVVSNVFIMRGPLGIRLESMRADPNNS